MAIRRHKELPLWIGPFKVTEVLPNGLWIMAAYEPDPSITVSRNAHQWKRLIVGAKGDVVFDPMRSMSSRSSEHVDRQVREST